MENWKSLDHLGVEVSDLGNVRNSETKQLLRIQKTGHGYRSVQAKGKSYRLHALVMLAFVGPMPNKHEINHINADRADNRLSNLEYVTSSQNKLHAVKLGRWPIGSRRWNAKLNDDKVREIRSKHSSGVSFCKIADEMGLNRTTVYHVVQRHNWTHVA